MDPFSIFFGTLNGMFTFANFALRVNEVGSEHAVFVRTIQVVRNDLAETERLLSIKPIQVKLISTPSKLEWIKGAVYSTKSAMNDIGKWVERARVDQQTLGKVSFNSKLRWVFNDHEKLVNRKTELSACHQQLSNVLGFLITLEEPSVSSNPPTYHATTFFEDTVSPRQQGASHISESREVSLDYLPRSTASPSGPSIEPSAAVHDSIASQPPTKFAHLATKHVASETDLLPPTYAAHGERASDGLRYTGLGEPGTSISPNNYKRYGEKEVEEKDKKKHTRLSYTKSLAIRGTNNHGPVDPHELFQTPELPTMNIGKRSVSDSDGRTQPVHAVENKLPRENLPLGLAANLVSELSTDQSSELPAGLSSELPAGLSSELPAELPSELPAELPSELPAELPSELPAGLSETHLELNPPKPIELPDVAPVELAMENPGPRPGYVRTITRKPVPEFTAISETRVEGPILLRRSRAASSDKRRHFESSSTQNMYPSPSIHMPPVHSAMPGKSCSVSLPSSGSASVSPVPSAPSPLPSPMLSSSTVCSHPYGYSHNSISSVSLLSSPWSTSMSSISPGLSATSSPALSSSNLAGHGWQTSRVRPSASRWQTASLSSTRMRNQKSHMDLLGKH